MDISYDKLWKLLVDRKMSTSELRKAASIAPNTIDFKSVDDYIYYHYVIVLYYLNKKGFKIS